MPDIPAIPGNDLKSLDVNGETDAQGWAFDLTGSGADDTKFTVAAGNKVRTTDPFLLPGIYNIQTRAIKGPDTIIDDKVVVVVDRGAYGFNTRSFLYAPEHSIPS